MVRPTATRVREISQVDFDAQGYPAPEGADPDPLQVQVDRACAYLEFVTWRPFDTMPGAYATLVEQAVQMRTEQLVFSLREENAETAGDFDMIGSFSAGAYSETRRDDKYGPGQMKPLNPWPALNDLLWMLLGLGPGEANPLVDERRDWWRWILGGAVAPAWDIVQVDWGADPNFSYGRLLPGSGWLP